MDNNNFINTNATESNQSNNFKAAKPKKENQIRKIKIFTLVNQLQFLLLAV